MMTLTELIEHTGNLASLLAIKRRQLDHMSLDSTARVRHETAIDALDHRVGELRRAADALRGEVPTLESRCVRPGVPPFPDVIVQPKTVRDLPATARKIST